MVRAAGNRWRGPEPCTHSMQVFVNLINNSRMKEDNSSLRSAVVPSLGMALAVISLFFTWHLQDATHLPGTAGALAAANPGAVFSEKLIRLTGFQVGANAPVTVAALLCGALFAVPETASRRSALLLGQAVCGVVLLMVPMHWLSEGGFKLLPGTVLAFSGALMVLYGILERWQMPKGSGS